MGTPPVRKTKREKRQTKEQSLKAQQSARIRREREAMILQLQNAENKLRAEGAEQTVIEGDAEEVPVVE
jgi:hypothetical protein